MASESKKIIRISLTVILILVIGGIILYPKLKPLLQKSGNQTTGTQARGPGQRGGAQALYASGYMW
jgi:membrane fusion protein, multidrug efflux system